MRPTSRTPWKRAPADAAPRRRGQIPSRKTNADALLDGTITTHARSFSLSLSFSLAPRVPAAAEKRHRTPEKKTMPSSQIQYSEKYYDDTYEYR